MPSHRAPCLFCPAPRTNHRGEHVFDDWINHLDGEHIKDTYEFTHYDGDGNVVRTFQKRKIDTTRPVVCDPCNHGWMSALTNETKQIIEGFVRYRHAASLLPLGVATITRFAFMKAAVVDAGDRRRPFLPRGWCIEFARTSKVPAGTQVWLAQYRSTKRFKTHVDSRLCTARPGAAYGFQFYVLTYVLGYLAIQATIPMWTKWTRRPVQPPILVQPHWWDRAAIPIWPHEEITSTEWPPPEYLDDKGLQDFADRFSKETMTRRRLS